MKEKIILCLALSALFVGCNTHEDDPEYHNLKDFNPASVKELVATEMNGQRVIMEKVNGQLIFQGDMVFDEQLLNYGTRGAGIYPWSPKKWKDNKVYYEIDPSIPNASAILAAIDDWQQNSNLTFFPRNGQPNYIKFVRSTSNNSYVGMKGGEQVINLYNYNIKYIVTHEIGHALGLWHEQTRADRDHYIFINWSNIRENQRHNFAIYDSGMDYGPFDFNSIMLYDSYISDMSMVYDINLPVMTKLDGSTFSCQNRLSDGDRFAIHTLYGPVGIYGNGDWLPVPADYDGNGKDDLAVKTNDGYWLIDYAENGFGKWDVVLAAYGDRDAIPVPADYDGDGKSDLSVKDGNGDWHIDYASNGFGSWDVILPYYGEGDYGIPVPADYDGDGKADLSIKRQDGQWMIDYSHTGFGRWDVILLAYGDGDAIPVPADYDGDGKADLSVKNGLGIWYIDFASNGFGSWDSTFPWYGEGDYGVPVPADYDGDGSADLSIKRHDGQWMIDYARNGFGRWDVYFTGYGERDAIPAPADYDGDGKVDLSIKNSTAQWFIDYASDSFLGWNWASSN